jgi:two-component system sensor histidine kinase BaeS
MDRNGVGHRLQVRAVNRRLAVLLTAVVATCIVLAELTLRPTGDDRWLLVLIITAPAVIAALVAPLLGRWVASQASITGVGVVVGLGSLTLAASASTAATNAMFLSSHDYRLSMVVLLLSSGIALAIGSELTRPLRADIAKVGTVASRVADGDLTAVTGIDRNDEVGRTAAAIDTMVISLREAADERARLSASRTMLLTSLGHDLRTPLAAMRAGVESLQDGLAPDPDRYLALLGHHLDSIDTLMEQIVEYARIEAPAPTRTTRPVAFTELVDEAAEALTPVADRRGVQLEVSADGPAWTSGDSGQLARVVRNLLSNAIRYSPAGATVRLDLHTLESTVQLRVRDQGPGFPDDFRRRAFEPFTRADEARDTSGGHAGLGLTICKALVGAHHGTIHVDDGPGGNIVVTLPRSAHR